MHASTRETCPKSYEDWECKTYKNSYEYNVDIHQLNTSYYKQVYDGSNKDKFTEIKKQISYNCEYGM
jgi:hypothetical protein